MGGLVSPVCTQAKESVESKDHYYIPPCPLAWTFVIALSFSQEERILLFVCLFTNAYYLSPANIQTLSNSAVKLSASLFCDNHQLFLFHLFCTIHF